MSDFNLRLRAGLAQVPEKLRQWWGSTLQSFRDAHSLLESGQPLSVVDGKLVPLQKARPEELALFDRRTSSTLLDQLHAIGDDLTKFSLSYATRAISQAPTAAAPGSIGQREVFRVVMEGVLQDTRDRRGGGDVNGLVARIREIIDDPGKSTRPETKAVPPSATANNGLLRSLHSQLDLYQTTDQVFDAINDLVRDTYRYEHMMHFAVEGLTSTVGTASTAKTADWVALWNALKAGIAFARSSTDDLPLQPGSLIYVYWLDEAGLAPRASRTRWRTRRAVRRALRLPVAHRRSRGSRRERRPHASVSGRVQSSVARGVALL